MMPSPKNWTPWRNDLKGRQRLREMRRGGIEDTTEKRGRTGTGEGGYTGVLWDFKVVVVAVSRSC